MQSVVADGLESFELHVAPSIWTPLADEGLTRELGVDIGPTFKRSLLCVLRPRSRCIDVSISATYARNPVRAQHTY